MFCVSYAEGSLTCKFEVNTAIFDFDRFEVMKKSDFPQLVPGNLNGAFCVSYAESRITCKFELNSAILDLHPFQVREKPIFHNSSRRPQTVRFVLVTLRAE